MTVNLSDSSSFFEPQPGVQWEWFIDDQVITNSDDEDVEYTFDNPGVYEPFLVVTNSAGCTDTSWAPMIYVGEPLPINFDMSPSPVCIGEEVTFEALGDLSDFEYFNFDADNSRWAGCFLEEQQTFTFQNQPGDQDVTVTAVYNGCESTFTQSFQVNGAVGRVSFDCICETPLDYDFIAEVQNGSSWDWNFGDNTELLNDNSNVQTHSYAESGDYDVILTTNSDDGCPPFQDTLTVKVRQLEAIIDPLDTLLCAGVPYSFNASASQDNIEHCFTGYTMFWGDGTPPNQNADGAFEHDFTNAGEQTIRLAVEDENGCRDTTDYEVNVFGISASLNSNINTGCLPLDVDFIGSILADTTLADITWDFGDLTSEQGLDSILSHQFNFPPLLDPFTQQIIPWPVSFTATDVLGCTNTTTVDILPIIPEVQLGSVSDPTICVGDQITLSPSPNSDDWTYLWEINGVQYTDPTPQIVMDEPGTFDVTISIVDENGCPADSFEPAAIDVQAYPEAIITSTADELEALCYPLQATFTNSSNYFGEPEGDLQWDLGNGSPVQPLNTVATTYDAPGNYVASIEVSTSYGCSDSAIDTLIVVGPVASLSLAPDVICKGEMVTLTMSDTTDVWVWEWDFGDGTTASGENPVEHTYFFNPPGGIVNPTLTVWSLD
ncbi:MAG: PKD domain-containing protein, partial [Bacteroidota bacterium]